MGKQPGGFWFDDDPEWEVLRRRANNEPVPKRLKKSVEPKIRRDPRPTAPPVKPDKKEVVVSIKLAVPKLRVPEWTRRYRHKILYIGVGLLGLVGLSVLGVKTFMPNKAGTDSKPTSAAEQARSDFQPLLPLPNATNADGQTQKQDYRYDEQRKLLGYSTEYNGANMVISQQPVPDNLKSDRDALKKVADSIGAKDQISTQKGMAYVATNDQSKEQTAVIITDGVLLFVRSNKKLDTDEWQFYLNQLRPSSD